MPNISTFTAHICLLNTTYTDAIKKIKIDSAEIKMKL